MATNSWSSRILITQGSESGRRNILSNLIKQQDDDNYRIIDKFYLCVKDPYEAKYQYLKEKREKNGLENPRAFTEYPRKLNISTVFTYFYSKVSKDFRLNSTRFFIMNIPNKWDLQ